MPGSADWELVEGGKDKPVTIWNIEEFVSLVVNIFLVDGVKLQLDSFRNGFNEVFPSECLKGLFTVNELEAMLCGMNTQKWTLEDLQKHTKCDHGYAMSSRSVINLWEVMSEFTPQEQREFLVFVTGSPNLPVGGWKSLNPKLTIVRKDHQNRGQSSPDQYLPSVMTCVNYLKLPDYSSKVVLKEKLLFAMKEGGGEFHLS